MFNKENTPFDYLRKYPTDKLLHVLQQETTESIAIVLCYMESDKAAMVLEKLCPSIQGDVLKCISSMNNISSETIIKVEKEIEEKLSKSLYLVSDGVELAVKILNKTNSRLNRQIINQLKSEDPELAEKMVLRVFNFDDIILLHDRHIQKVLREIDSHQLAKALKLSNIEIQDKCFRNMSRRAASMLREDMEYMGPVRLTDAEDAQEKIIKVIRKLEDTGEIQVSRYHGVYHEEEVINGEVSHNNINYLTSPADVLEVSDSFIKKLISIVGVRFLASVFHGEENEEAIFKKIHKNLPFYMKRSFARYWKSREKIFKNDEAKECIISLIKNEMLIEKAKNQEGVSYGTIKNDSY